jgi:hypothetical protein
MAQRHKRIQTQGARKGYPRVNNQDLVLAGGLSSSYGWVAKRITEEWERGEVRRDESKAAYREQLLDQMAARKRQCWCLVFVFMLVRCNLPCICVHGE